MRPPRSARLLPRYMLRKPLKNGTWAYFFNVPTWARKAGCPIANEPLGGDYEAAIARAENILLPAFDAWRMGGAKDAPPAGGVLGTLDWVFAEYRADRRFTKLDTKTRRNHEAGFRLVGSYTLKDGRRFGSMRAAIITTAVFRGGAGRSGLMGNELWAGRSRESRVSPTSIAPTFPHCAAPLRLIRVLPRALTGRTFRPGGCEVPTLPGSVASELSKRRACCRYGRRAPVIPLDVSQARP
jgi:hypothetical protein